MKRNLIILLATGFSYINAQVDSTKNITFSGIQLEMPGIMTFNSPVTTREQLQKFVPNDHLLNADLTGFAGYPQWSGNTDFNGLVGARAFFTMKKKGKLRKDLFIGINYGANQITYMHYNKVKIDTLDTFTSTTNKKLYRVNYVDNSYNYNVSSSQLLVPMGISLTTNKMNRCWFTTGLEAGLGVTFAYKFMSSNYLTQNQYFMEENAVTPSYYPFGGTDYSFKVVAQNTVKLSTVGFVGYVSAPVSINLRVSKKVKFLKHMNLGLSLAPGYAVSKNAIAGTNSSFSLMTNFAIRYNLFKK